MDLKSVNEKCELMYLYWAICLYFSKAVFQSCSFIGGKAPMIGFHSVMERPEPVSRVIPPSRTWIMIMPTPTNNQMATGLEDLFVPGFVIAAQRYREVSEVQKVSEV